MKAEKFLADVVEVLNYKPKFFVDLNSVIAECMEVCLSKTDLDRFYEALNLGHTVKEVDGQIVVRFIKPQRQFYNYFISCWFSLKPTTLRSLDSMGFIGLAIELFASKGWRWD